MSTSLKITKTISRESLMHYENDDLMSVLSKKEISETDLIRFFEPAAKLLMSIYESTISIGEEANDDAQ